MLELLIKRKYKLRREWSLIFFTLLTQLAVGSFILVAGFNNFSILKSESILTRELTLIILYVILTFSIIAMVSSFLHLGKPQNAMYALTNIGSSWLSREILFVVIFVAFTSIYTFFEYTFMEPSKLKMFFAIAGILFGLGAVFSMAKLYMLETVPAWISLNTFVQFYSTVIILGIISFSLILLLSNPIKLEQLSSLGVYKIFLVVLLNIISISLAFFLFKIWSLLQGGQTELESLNQITIQSSALFYSRIIFSVITILIILYQLLIAENIYSNYSIILLSITAILSEFVGRYLFYAGYKRIGI